MLQGPSIVWEPQDSYIQGSHLQHLIQHLGMATYDHLYDYSIQHPDQFWAASLQLLGIEWFQPYHQWRDVSNGKPWPRWFVSGKINFVYNCLRWADSPLTRHQTAIIWEGEDGAIRQISYEALKQQVHHCTAVLRARGLQKGDRVALYLPMLPETVVAFLAIAALGAIAVPLFSGFGPQAVQTRLEEAEAHVLITADGFYRRGQAVPLLFTIREVIKDAPQLKQVIVVNRINQGESGDDLQFIGWDTIMKQSAGQEHIEPMDANDPYLILYTSGTTGKPKGIVHIQGGFPFKVTQDAAHLFDIREQSVFFWPTDMGWMVGPLLITAGLTLGATIVLYEGAPDYPDWGRIGRLLERHQVTHFGLTPTLIRSMAMHPEQALNWDKEHLRIMITAGEVCDSEAYLWLFQQFGQGQRPIMNYSGGTEVAGGIVSNVLYRPIKVGGFNTVVPGIHAAVLNKEGQQMREQPGELAILDSFVGMTCGFWKEPERYVETYWGQQPGTWIHGDLAIQDREGQFFILGRSDDTLKMAGKRVGAAEVEAIILEHAPQIAEVAAIGVPHPQKGEELVLFVVPQSSALLSRLEQELSQLVEKQLGKAFRPGKVYRVTALPRTRNAKLMRRVIRRVYLGQPPGDLSALENPEALQGIQQKSHRIEEKPLT